jgi:acyl-homoserine lactone acylase PvdQ
MAREQSIGGRVGMLAALVGFCALLAPGFAIAAPPPPGAYQENDFGGVRSILPAGQAGFVRDEDAIAVFGGLEPPPAHARDQLDPYVDLIDQSPGLTETQVDQAFKEASFGVQPADVERTYTPNCAVSGAPSASSEHCDDVTIVRDRSWGVPHIYGADRAGLMFGIGYATAEDRLFQMDVQRHAGRAELSSFIGGSQAATDQATWRAAPYTEADLQRQVDLVDDIYGAEGAQLVADSQNFVDGINQYIAEALLDPANKMPGEYGLAVAETAPEPWKITDVLATGALVAGAFGKGGGAEVRSARVLEAARARFGEQGDDVWADFRSAEDGETPTTVKGQEFPYLEPPASPAGVALPDPGTIERQPVVVGKSGGQPERASAVAPVPVPAANGSQPASSNALLVSAAESESGRALAVMGPQIGYFSPPGFIEQDIHAPGGPEGPAIDARGGAFPGANTYVQIGRGRDYAWSATSAGQDITDSFALPLCVPGGGEPTLRSGHYLFDGQCRSFEVLEKTNSWEPSLADSTPAGSQTLRALRTALGIVTHRGMIDGEPHVFTELRATYFHEADSGIGLAEFNSPEAISSPQDFQAAAARIDYTFNWLYADRDHIAYFNSGANPVRAPNTDPNLPILGEPQFLWQGFNPAAVLFEREPPSAHAQTIDQRFITSWNNKQAPGYRAADGDWTMGSVDRADLLNREVRSRIAGDETMTRAELVDAMAAVATIDLRGAEVLPWALKVMRSGDQGIRPLRIRRAVRTLQAWHASGAHRIDANDDGTYEDSRAVALMDALWPRLVSAQFKPELGGRLYRRIKRINVLHDELGGSGSAFDSGWYSYVHKDLRRVLGEDVEDPFSREYCGGGNLSRCRELLLGALSRAARQSPEEIYGTESACDEGDLQWCFDALRFSSIGVIPQPNLEWQNRPTATQQVVEFQGHR